MAICMTQSTCWWVENMLKFFQLPNGWHNNTEIMALQCLCWRAALGDTRQCKHPALTMQTASSSFR
jgi:hypothetical protein